MIDKKEDVQKEVSTYQFPSPEDAADLGLPPPPLPSEPSPQRGNPLSPFLYALLGTLVGTLILLLSMSALFAFAIAPTCCPELTLSVFNSNLDEIPEVIHTPSAADSENTPEPTNGSESTEQGLGQEPATLRQITKIDLQINEDANCNPDEALSFEARLHFDDNSTNSVPTCLNKEPFIALLPTPHSSEAEETAPQTISLSLSKDVIRGNETVSLTIKLFTDTNRTVPFDGNAEVIIAVNSQNLTLSNALPTGQGFYAVQVQDVNHQIQLTADNNIFVSAPIQVSAFVVGSDNQIVSYETQVHLKNLFVEDACETTRQPDIGAYNDPLTTKNSLYRLPSNFIVPCDRANNEQGSDGEYHLFTHNLWVSLEQLTEDNTLDFEQGDTIVTGLCGPVPTTCTVDTSQGTVAASSIEISLKNIEILREIAVERTGRNLGELVEVQFNGRIFKEGTQSVPTNQE